MNFGADTMREQLRAGQAVGLNRHRPEYTEGISVIDDVCQQSRSALDAFAAWMPPFLELWSHAFSALRTTLH